MSTEDKDQVRAYYNRQGATFDNSYDWEGPLYPSNRIRMDLCLDRLAQAGAHRVLDAGCGTGVILAELLKRGYDAWGFDFSLVAVEQARERLGPVDQHRAVIADIEQPMILRHVTSYDAVLIMGAFTHPLNHDRALRSLHDVTRPGGLLLVELRNLLMGFFSWNEYTAQLLSQMMSASPLTEIALEDIRERLSRRPPIPPETEIQRAHEEFFSVPSVWRNPLTVDAEYRAAGWRVIDKLGFHWHAVPPGYEPLDREAFRRESLALEWQPHDWRWMFMCSAFLLVAERI